MRRAIGAPVTSSTLDRDVLERLAHSIRRVLVDGGIDRATASGEPIQVADVLIERVFDLGVVHVAKALWDKLGISEAIQKRIREKKLKAPHEMALFAMAAQRLDRPDSKLACHQRWLDRVWLPDAKDLGLYQLYRAMDLLAEHGDAIEEEVLPTSRATASGVTHSAGRSAFFIAWMAVVAATAQTASTAALARSVTSTPPNGFFEKRFGCGLVPMLRQHEIKGFAELVDGAIQIHPLAFDLRWSKKRDCASPPRTVYAPFSAYGSPFKLGSWPWRHHDSVT